MLTMTVTRILYFLSTFSVLLSVIHAYQPDGYLGCFRDFDGDSLVNSTLIYKNNRGNNGQDCKAGCKNHTKRYAGTKEWMCFCGSGVFQNMNSSSTECNQLCSTKSNETCGGIKSYPHDRISIYDTWLCITDPCQNGATCTDLNATSYNCSCSDGWTGRVCNAKVNNISSSSSAQADGSSTTAEKDTATAYSISLSSSRQDIGSSTVVDQPSENKLAIYIAVPVSIVVLIVFVLIVTVLILRKRLSRNKEGRKTVYQTSANTSRSLIGVAYDAHNDHDIKPLETCVNVHASEYAAIRDSEHNYCILEKTGDVNRSYNNADQTSGSAMHNDESGYGHLNARSTALCDPTYSHTTMTGPQGTTDNTYSHMDLSVGNKNQEVKSYVDKDTYNTCNMKGDVGKLRPAVEITDTDDTYNRLAISGKAKNVDGKHIVSSLNEPEYDHTDVKKH